MNENLHWDDVLALGYAAEQLCVAGQLLTSDVVPLDQAVQTACGRHIGGLLAVRHLLPRDLVKKLEGCLMECPANVALTRSQAERLGRRVLGIMEDVRRVLNAVAEHETGEGLQNAA